MKYVTGMALFIFCASVVYSQSPRLMMPAGHMYQVKDAFFSTDDKYIITHAENVKIWEAATGKLLKNIDAKEDPNEVYLTGKGVLIIAYPDSVRLWNLETDRLIKAFSGNSFQTTSDQSRLIIMEYSDADESKNKNARLYDLNTFRLLQQFDMPIVSPGRNNNLFIGVDIGEVRIYDSAYTVIYTNSKGNMAGVSPDLRYLAVQYDTSLAIVDAYKKTVLQEFTTDAVSRYSVRFMPDSNMMLIKVIPHKYDGRYVSQSDNSYFAGIDMTTFQVVHQYKEQKGNLEGWAFAGGFVAASFNDSTIRIWNARSGKLVFEVKDSAGVSKNIDFSENLQYIIASSYNNAARVWDIAKQKLHKALESNTNFLDRSRFSVDGKLGLFKRSDDVWLWDIQKGKPVFSQSAGAGRSVLDCRLSNSGARLFIHTQKKIPTRYGKANTFYIDFNEATNDQLNLYDVATGALEKTVSVPATFYRYAVNNSGEKVVIAGTDSSLYLADMTTGTVTKKYVNRNGSINDVEYTTDGKQIATVENDVFKIYDSYTFQTVYQSKEAAAIHTYGYHPATGIVILVLNNKKVVIRNVRTKTLVKEIAGYEKPGENNIYTNQLFSIVFDNTGRFACMNNLDNRAVIIIEAATGTNYKTLELKKYPDKLFFTKDNHLQICFSGSEVQEWDLMKQQLVRSTVLDAEYIDDIQGNGNYLLAHSRTAIKLVDLAANKIKHQLYLLPNSNYIVTDLQDHYDGTDEARQSLYFTCGTEVIELDQVKDQLWVPNLAGRIMKDEKINAPGLASLDICGLTPQVLSLENSGSYNFTILPRKGGLGETILAINGIEIKRYRPEQLTKITGGYSLSISKTSLQPYFIPGQDNSITVKANTARNDISSRGAGLTHKEGKKNNRAPNLYAVMVGVSDYKGDKLDLKYAAKDAHDLSGAIVVAAKKLLNTDNKEHVFLYNINTGNNRMYFPEKQAIQNIFGEIGKKATANDILLIFFAGHGVMAGEKKQFYFLTADASENADVAATGISIQELSEWMKPDNIKAQKRILIFDACNSGQAINELVKIGEESQQYVAARNDNESNQVKAIEKLNERSGMFILSAAASNQSAYEMGRYAQGLLTYALLKTIKEQPAILEDGKYLNVDGWFRAAEKTVADIVSQTGNRQQPQKFGTGGFNIGIVDEEVITAIQLPQQKPLFTASNFQNNDELVADDDLEFSKLVNRQLNDFSSRETGSNISYISFTNSPDAYTLSGRYEISGNEVLVRVNLRQSKTIKHRFEVKGNKSDLLKIAADIVLKANAWMAKNL